MKKALVLILFTFGMNVLVSQSINPSAKTILTKAPKKVSNKFIEQYPNVKPSWTLDGENYQAKYPDSKTQLNHFVLYDKEGNVMRKESELDYKEYPVVINQYHSWRFPNETFKVLQCEAPNGDKYYYSKRKNEIIKFDTLGNYISDKSEKIRFLNRNKGQMAN